MRAETLNEFDRERLLASVAAVRDRLAVLSARATNPELLKRLREADVYRCGDGVCQFTESCGNGTQYDNCRSDCGRCR